MCRGDCELQTLRPERRDASSASAAEPWRGVNLGGWLLLEPGTAKDLFSKHAVRGVEATCEWDLMQTLRRKDAIQDLELHRETYITKADFYKLRSCGLNAVRLPFGYWVVLGAAAGEPYVGPALQYIDRALDWAEECGLQVVLDLHGAPGGESGEAPCGRHRSNGDPWTWRQWRFDESLRALTVVAQRYAGRKVVTGIEVCNEPSKNVPTGELCKFYSQAVDAIREAGMHDHGVTVVLPVFQRSASHFAKAWSAVTRCRHKNICFDFHYYHCFGNEWQGKTLAKQLRHVQEHARELKQYPAVVGEWSLALGLAAYQGRLLKKEARTIFGRAQLEAYQHASHGWFFWNWKDGAGTEWDWWMSYEEGALLGKPYEMPPWDGTGEDPLEEDLDPSPAEAGVYFGDAVRLRAYHGRYIDAVGQDVRITCAEKCTESRFVISSPPGVTLDEADRKPLLDGSIVCLRACSTGNFLKVGDKSDEDSDSEESMETELEDAVSDASKQSPLTLTSLLPPEVHACRDASHTSPIEFIVHVDDSSSLQHRGAVFLQSKATLRVVHVDGDALGTRWEDFGTWQRFSVEKLRVQPASAQVQLQKDLKEGVLGTAAIDSPILTEVKPTPLCETTNIFDQGLRPYPCEKVADTPACLSYGKGADEPTCSSKDSCSFFPPRHRYVASPQRRMLGPVAGTPDTTRTWPDAALLSPFKERRGRSRSPLRRLPALQAYARVNHIIAF